MRIFIDKKLELFFIGCCLFISSYLFKLEVKADDFQDLADLIQDSNSHGVNLDFCNDTDDGNNPLIKGIMTVHLEINWVKEGYSFIDVISLEENVLKEYFCSENSNGNYTAHSIEYKCLAETQGDGFCKPVEINCFDSDWGKNSFIKGEIIGVNYLGINFKEEDKCNKMTDGVQDFDVVIEGYCDEDWLLKQEAIKCLFGCKDGVCKEWEVEKTCVDSDSGKKYYEKWYRINYNTSFFDYRIKNWDFCIEWPDIAILNSNKIIADRGKEVLNCNGNNCYVIEYICNENDISDVHVGYQCVNWCRDWACIKNNNTNIKVIPPAGYEDEVIVNFEEFPNPFSDTNITSLEGKASAELYRRAIIGGYSDGEFKGDRFVNRAEAAKFLLLAKFWEIEESINNGQFGDVKEGEWYVKYIVQATKKGIIKGYSNGLFKPQNGVNTVEFLKMFTLTFNLEENLPYAYDDVKKDDWFAKYIWVSEKYELFPNRSNMLFPGKGVTRREIAIAIYQYLLKK